MENENDNDLKLQKSKSDESNHEPTHTTIIHVDSKITQPTPSGDDDDDDDDEIEIVTIDDIRVNDNKNKNNDNNNISNININDDNMNDNDNDNHNDNNNHNDNKHKKNETISIPKSQPRVAGSMRIVLSSPDTDTDKLLNQTPSQNEAEHTYSHTTIIKEENKSQRNDSEESTASFASLNSPSSHNSNLDENKISTSQHNIANSGSSSGSGSGSSSNYSLDPIEEDKIQWKKVINKKNAPEHNKQAESHVK